MARKSPKDRSRARTRGRQKSTKSAQEFSNLDADLVQQIHELLLDWRGAVEARNPKSIFVTEGRRSDWQRAVHPDPANKPRTWWKHVDRVVGFFQEEWNSIRQEDEEPLKLTRAAFLRGPPGRAMRPIASADLQELPSLGSAGIIHLHGYLDDLRVRVEKSQALQNIVAERALRDSIVSALENLGHWSFCADEMEHLVQINEQLQDFTEVGRCLLPRNRVVSRGAIHGSEGSVRKGAEYVEQEAAS